MNDIHMHPESFEDIIRRYDRDMRCLMPVLYTLERVRKAGMAEGMALRIILPHNVMAGAVSAYGLPIVRTDNGSPPMLGLMGGVESK